MATHDVDPSTPDPQALMQVALMHDMPLFYAGLVVENTTRCNARCGMCYQSAGPQGSDTWGKKSLTVEEIKRVIGEALEIETLFPRFHLSGGEAFLDVDGCLEIFAEARRAGFLDITTTTNAYWAADPARARDICTRLRSVGLTSMEISWDHWHLPYVSGKAVSNCLDACQEANIETNLRLLSTKTHSFSEALGHLRPESLERASRITGGPVFATGRAKESIPAADFYSQTELDGNCHNVLNLTINALGNVFPCCAGIDQTNNHLFGNVRERSLPQIAEAMSSSALLRTIVFGGIASLIPIIEEAGIHVGRDYNGICHLCWSIFSRPECVRALDDYFEDASVRALRRVVEALRASV